MVIIETFGNLDVPIELTSKLLIKIGHIEISSVFAPACGSFWSVRTDACQAPSAFSVGPPRRPVWQSEPKLLEWLAGL